MVTSASSPSVWNMPLPVAGYRSYTNVRPMRFDAPASLASLNFSFSGMKTKSSCPSKDIHITIGMGGLPLVDLSENSLPDNFIPPSQPSIDLIIRSGQIAELVLMRPPPGPYYIVGYLKDVDSGIKQKGLHPETSCFHMFSSTTEFSAPLEATEILPGDDILAEIDTNGSLFRFTVPPNTINFEVQVLSCESAPCNISLKHLTFVPKESREIIEDCSNVTSRRCLLHVSSPALDQAQLIELKYAGGEGNATLLFTLKLQECPLFVPGSTNLLCGLTPPLNRIQSPMPLATRFGFILNTTVTLMTNLSSGGVTSIPFTLLEPNDIGGSLKWQLRLIGSQSQQANLSRIQVCGGLLFNKLPDTSLSALDLCTVGIPGVVNLEISLTDGVTHDEAGAHAKRYVAYPQAGRWHIVLQAHCFGKNNTSLAHCDAGAVVDMALEIQECVDGGCSDHGTCVSSTTGSDFISFSACQCDADYRGYGCSDSRHAQAEAVQLAGAYLLTLSNLFFLPAIVLGLARGFTVEAFVYSFNMFFSTFYHACDGSRLQKYKVCITDYYLLQLADFFGSACSLWFTLVAMARLRPFQGLLHVVGIFVMFVIVVSDKTSLALMAVPILAGLVIIACSWGSRMYQRKRLYPSWRRYTFYLVPGVCLAGVGGVCFSFLETESNYKYLHSLWHMCVALSIVLLLPPKSERKQGHGVAESAFSMSHLPEIPFSEDLS